MVRRKNTLNTMNTLNQKFYPVLIASVAFFLSYYTRLTWSILSVYVPFKPSVNQDAHIFAIYFFSYIIIQIPAGFLSDKYSGGRIVFFSLIGLAIASFMSGLALNIEQEYIASFLMGFSSGWVYPATINIMNYYYKEDRSIYLGYYSVAWPLAIVIAGIIIAPIAIYFSWRWVYFLSGFFSIIFAILSYPLKTDYQEKKIDLSVIKDKNVILISIAGFLFFFSYWSIVLYAYKYFVSIGIDKVIAGFIFSAMALAGLFSSAISGFIINKFGLMRTMVLMLFLYSILTVSFAFTTSAIMLIIISLLMGIARFSLVPIQANFLTIIGKQNTGSVTGIANMFWQSSGIFGPLLSSYLIKSMGFEYFWIALGIIVLVSIFFYKAIKIC